MRLNYMSNNRTRNKLSAREPAEIQARQPTADTPVAATFSFEVVHNTHRSPNPQLHILLIPANRVIASRYTTLDNIPVEYLAQVQTKLLEYMHHANLTIHYIEPSYDRNTGRYTKAYLAVERGAAV